MTRTRLRFRGLQAQATVEYILVLSIAVGLFVVVGRVLGPWIERWTNAVSQRIDQTLSQPDGYHRFNF